LKVKSFPLNLKRIHLVDNGHMSKISEPWGTGTKRYIISNEEIPIHPNGKDFFVPVEYGSYTLESHCSRKKAMKNLDDLCQKLGLKYGK